MSPQHTNTAMVYEIARFIPETGQIVVKCEGLDQPLVIDLPVDNGRYPEGDDLDIYIRGFIPVWLIERAQNIKRGIFNAGAIANLVGVKNYI